MTTQPQWAWQELRHAALHEAIALGPAASELALLDRAERFYRFLLGAQPTRLVLQIGPTVKQNTTTPRGGPFQEASMAQLHDDEEFDLTVSARDAKGFETPDAFTAASDNESVATVDAQADGRTFTVVAGVPGSAVVTVTDGTLSATLAVDVVPGGAVLVDLVSGEVRKQA